MVSADHITFTDDGHAWWVMGNEVYRTVNEIIDGEIVPLDRPCDTCGGAEVIRDEELDEAGVVVGIVWESCPECIDGRHAFDIEVDGYWNTLEDRRWPRTYRVSVVPGMVLPIYRNLPDNRRCVVMHATRGTRLFQADGSNEHITLPPAAAPGMWAVKLKVAS